MPKKKTLITGAVVCLSWCLFRLYNEYASEHQTNLLFTSNGKRSTLLSINGLDATIYSQVPLKAFDKAKLKAYYNLRELTEQVTDKSSSGLTAEIPNHNLIWITRKNCTAVSLPIEHVFSYKEQDSLAYTAKKFHSLKVKSIISLK